MKKRVVNKLLAVVLGATMVIGMLGGCGGKKEESSSSETTTTTTTESTGTETTTTEGGENTTAASGEVVTINVTRATFNLASPDTDQVKKVEDAINAYIADKINVQIKLTDIGSGEFTDKANLSLQAGEINLLWTASWEQSIGTDDLYKADAAYDITAMVEASPLYDTMPAGIWEASKYDGKILYVPCYKESAEGYDLMVRSELIDQYGWDISTISSLKDIEPMLEQLKADGLKYPYLTQKTAMFYRWGIDDFDFFAQVSFIGVDRDTDEVVDVVTSDEYLEFCTLMGEWADKGYISEDDYTKVTTDTTTQTQDWGFSWWTDVPNNEEADSRYQQSVDMVKLTDNWAHSTTTLGSCFAVTANSSAAEAQACVDFLALLYTDQTLADMYTFGIEGEDFNYNADGTVTQASEKYHHSAWESCNVECLSLTDSEPSDKVDLYKAFNNGSKTSSAAGFRFNKAAVEAEYTACYNVYEEYGFILENGGYPASDVAGVIADYQAALDGAGYQTLLAEAQAQYEAWKASK